MTIDVLKKQVTAAVAPLEAIVVKRGDYDRVQVNLPNGSEIAGFFKLDSDIDINDIAAQAQAAEREGREKGIREIGPNVYKDRVDLLSVQLPLTPKGLTWSKVKNRFKNTPWAAEEQKNDLTTLCPIVSSRHPIS